MIPVYSPDEVRQAEAAAMAQLPEGALMQRAAFGLASECARLLAALRGAVVGARVVLLVGKGNNGGDALWAGAFLRARGCSVEALAVDDSQHAEGAGALLRAGGALRRASNDERRSLDAADLIIDGILGIGGAGALRGTALHLADHVADSRAIVVAVDIPSGVNAESGAVEGQAVRADVTITFACVKPGLLLSPGRDYAGRVHRVDIGIDTRFPVPSVNVMQSSDVAAYVLDPTGEDYKYSRGVAGIAAGSGPYPGAALLCTAAARGTGTGMVRYLDRGDGLAATVVSHFPDIVVDGSAPERQGRAQAWGCGPGFVGDGADLPSVMAVLDAPTPVVLDAGALRVVADSSEARDLIRDRTKRALTTVVTPHEGEFRLLAPGLLDGHASRLAAAGRAARDLSAVVVLKGAGTVIATPTGDAWIDTEGTADLGVAGSGDVLTGIIASLLSQWSASGGAGNAGQVVAAAVWLHGRAGRVAAAGGPVTAVDIASALRAAVQDARFARDEVPA